MPKLYQPHSISHKGSYVGIGVGPIRQAGNIFTETQLRDQARKLARSLNEESLEKFMKTVKYKGIHQPAKDPKWEWCPLKSFKGYCPCCTHIFVVSDMSTGKYLSILKENHNGI